MLRELGVALIKSLATELIAFSWSATEKYCKKVIPNYRSMSPLIVPPKLHFFVGEAQEFNIDHVIRKSRPVIPDFVCDFKCCWLIKP